MRRIALLRIVTTLLAAALALSACSGQPAGTGSGTNGGGPSSGGSDSGSVDAHARQGRADVNSAEAAAIVDFLAGGGGSKL